MIEQLPKAFLSRMKDILGDEYDDFLKSYEHPRHFGLRVNNLKISTEKFLEKIKVLAFLYLTVTKIILGRFLIY